jgi:HlyD family secretion protein
MGEADSVTRGRAIVLGVLVAVGAGGWLVGSLRAEPRGSAGRDSQPGVVTAPVERRALESVQVTRGTVVSPAQASVKAPQPGEGEFAVVVTRTPQRRGGEIVAGAVVLELNGRPVLALPGRIPLFRDIRPGMAGPDIEALQIALRAMGYDIPSGEPVFGLRTQAAVEDVYTDAGYAPVYTLGERASVDGARATADEAVRAGEAHVFAGRASGTPDLAAAEAELASAEADQSRAWQSEGVILPAHEIVAAPTLPATLVELPVAEGQRVEPAATLASIGSSQFQVQVDLSSAQFNDLTPDMSITVNSDAGYQATCPPGEPQRVEPGVSPGSEGPQPTGGSEPTTADTQPTEGDESATEGAGGAAVQGQSYQMTVTCDPLPPAESLGASLRVTMTVRRSDGPVLVVPTTSITTTESGEAFVEVVTDDGATTRVAVRLGGEAGGFAAVDATDGRLTEGMNVRVRRR